LGADVVKCQVSQECSFLSKNSDLVSVCLHHDKVAIINRHVSGLKDHPGRIYLCITGSCYKTDKEKSVLRPLAKGGIIARPVKEGHIKPITIVLGNSLPPYRCVQVSYFV